MADYLLIAAPPFAVSDVIAAWCETRLLSVLSAVRVLLGAGAAPAPGATEERIPPTVSQFTLFPGQMPGNPAPRLTVC